jgi:CxxC-x17-CxxC domain-containing protein
LASSAAVVDGMLEGGDQPVRPTTKGGIHTATCSQCGRTATLRFAPDLSRPVYCDACYGERRKQSRAAR